MGGCVCMMAGTVDSREPPLPLAMVGSELAERVLVTGKDERIDAT
jgi:hypothetical protein